MGIGARGNDLQLGCFSPTNAGKEADVQLQAAQFLFSNCLPGPSSIFHSSTAENNTSLKFNRMWKPPPCLETLPFLCVCSAHWPLLIQPSVIYVSCFNSQTLRANIGLSSSRVPELSLYPSALGNAPKSWITAWITFIRSVWINTADQ